MGTREGSARWYRRWWVIATALVLVVVAVCVVAISIGGDDRAPAGPQTSPPPVSSGLDGYLPDTADRFGQQIRVPRDPAGLTLTQIPVTTPRTINDPAAGLQWQRVYSFGSALFSTSDGPGRISSAGLAEQIAHTAQGSVIAATHILARLYFGPSEVTDAVLAQQLLGPDSVKTSLREVQLPNRQYAVARFIRVDPQYSDTFSRVSLASGPRAAANDPSHTYYRVTTMNMVWADGQWKWRIPDEGFSTATGDTTITSVTGWTTW